MWQGLYISITIRLYGKNAKQNAVNYYENISDKQNSKGLPGIGGDGTDPPGSGFLLPFCVLEVSG